jgi:hypothetical protein
MRSKNQVCFLNKCNPFQIGSVRLGSAILMVNWCDNGLMERDARPCVSTAFRGAPGWCIHSASDIIREF